MFFKSSYQELLPREACISALKHLTQPCSFTIEICITEFFNIKKTYHWEKKSITPWFLPVSPQIAAAVLQTSLQQQLDIDDWMLKRLQVTIWKFALLCVVFFSFLYFRNSFQKRPLPLWYDLYDLQFQVKMMSRTLSGYSCNLQWTVPSDSPHVALPSYFIVLGTHEWCFLCALRQAYF